MKTANDTNSANSANVESENFISDLKKRNAKINKLHMIFEKFYMGNGRTPEEKQSAKENIFNGISAVTHCKRFGQCDNGLVQCKNCTGSTATQAKIKAMCEVFTAENKAQQAEQKKAKKDKKPVDKYGLRLDSKIHFVVEMLSVQPLKMADIKKATGDSYYNIAKRRPELFGCNENGYWFIKGTDSEKLAKEIDENIKKATSKVFDDLKNMSDKFKAK